jgi:8-oxo-dGTP diphosphatase
MRPGGKPGKPRPETCPHCGEPLPFRTQPRLTVDLLALNERGEVLLVRRRFPPPGWALPGGFVEWGETLEDAVLREALEETGLRATLVRQLHTFSEPGRDPRGHTVTTVFLGRATGMPHAGDDAGEARFFPRDLLPHDLAFDHGGILAAFFGGTFGPAP